MDRQGRADDGQGAGGLIRTGAAIAGALALASAAAAQPSMPVARATDVDRLLVGLADEAAGEAIVTLRHDEASNAPTCKAGSVRGGQAIADASCTLALKKLGWATAGVDRNGKRQALPRLRIAWTNPDKAGADSDATDEDGLTPISPERWILPADYPGTRAQGASEFILDVAPSGRPTACHITKSAGSDILDRKTCEVLMRSGLFLPALDAQGKPRPAQFRSRLSWAIE